MRSWRRAFIGILALGILQGEEIRLRRQSPDLKLRLRATYHAPGERPLSLVLGGGSAKGLAHIGVFEVLEEEGLSETAITGTSAGALMGSFRAAGFSGPGLRWAFKHTDFGNAIFDSRRRTGGMTLSEEEERQATVVRFDLRPEGWEFLPGAVAGRAATQTLQAHLIRADALCHGDFSQLGVPFACIASNLNEGKLHCFTSGNLVTAVRASMSIPGVFRPVETEGGQLVDGGISQTLPVLEARRLHPGALQLAVDVSDPWESGPVRNPFSLLGRSLAHSVEVMSRLNRDRADVLLRPAVGGFDLFNFHDQVDALADRGRQAMHQALPALEEHLYGEDGARPLEAGHWRLVGPELPALRDLAQACLPPGAPWRKRDAFRLLRRAHARGLAADVWVARDPAAPTVLEIHYRPNPVITRMSWALPAAWQADIQRLAEEAGLGAGRPFNEPAWSSLLQGILVRGSLMGRPLIDLSGSGLDAEGTLHIVARESAITGLAVDDTELRPASKRVMDEFFVPMLGKPLETDQLAGRLLELDHALNLQNPKARLEVGPEGDDWILGLKASDRHRVQVNVAAAYESTWGLHGVVDAWLKDFLVKGHEWWFHGYADKIQQGASLSLQHAFLAHPSTGFFLGARYARHRFEGDPLLGYFGAVPDPDGYQRLIENASERMTDLFGGLFQRFGQDRKGKVELEVQRRNSALMPRGQPWIKNAEDTVTLSSEWDSFDRSFFPTEGLQLRARVAAGRAETRVLAAAGPAPAWEQPRQAYLLVRALAKDVVGPVGADIALETGLGWRTLLIPDRQYILGGDASFIGTPGTRFLAPNFAILRAGLPIPLRRAFGGHVQIVPRLDVGRFSQDPTSLTSDMRVVGQGVVVRGAVGKFYIETGWGTIQVRSSFPGPLRREHQFNILVGARPFDLWTRK
ncbi:MAG TPA: patatin-like phospholipase family protein [Geothrix sp.]|nr:patatin-like phospholipase family protein [Geothrix sp.]